MGSWEAPPHDGPFFPMMEPSVLGVLDERLGPSTTSVLPVTTPRSPMENGV